MADRRPATVTARTSPPYATGTAALRVVGGRLPVWARTAGDTVGDGVMGREPGGAMRRRYRHLTDPVLRTIADELGHTLWGGPEGGQDEDDDGPRVPRTSQLRSEVRPKVAKGPPQ